MAQTHYVMNDVCDMLQRLLASEVGSTADWFTRAWAQSVLVQAANESLPLIPEMFHDDGTLVVESIVLAAGGRYTGLPSYVKVVKSVYLGKGYQTRVLPTSARFDAVKAQLDSSDVHKEFIFCKKGGYLNWDPPPSSSLMAAVTCIREVMDPDSVPGNLFMVEPSMLDVVLNKAASRGKFEDDEQSAAANFYTRYEKALQNMLAAEALHLGLAKPQTKG